MNLALIVLLGLSAVVDLALGAWASVSWTSFVDFWFADSVADQVSSPGSQLLGLVLGLALAFFALLQGLAIRWIRGDEERGYSLIFYFGGYLVASSILTTIFLWTRPVTSFGPALFLVVDGLRGAALVVIGYFALHEPATVSELKLPHRHGEPARRGSHRTDRRRRGERAERGTRRRSQRRRSSSPSAEPAANAGRSSSRSGEGRPRRRSRRRRRGSHGGSSSDSSRKVGERVGGPTTATGNAETRGLNVVVHGDRSGIGSNGSSRRGGDQGEPRSNGNESGGAARDTVGAIERTTPETSSGSEPGDGARGDASGRTRRPASKGSR